MAVRIRTEQQLEWQKSQEGDEGDYDRTKLSEDELNIRFRIREMGSQSCPQLIELLYEPGHTIQLHSHDEDEIIYVLKGEMVLGKRVYASGTSIYIPGGTYYTFRAGAEGLQILNFRPCKDMTFHVAPPK